MILDDQLKRLLRNYLLLCVAFLAAYGHVRYKEVARWSSSAEGARQSLELCRPRLAECRVLEQERERQRPKAPRAPRVPRERPVKNPCPEPAMGNPMPRPCPAPDE